MIAKHIWNIDNPLWCWQIVYHKLHILFFRSRPFCIVRKRGADDRIEYYSVMQNCNFNFRFDQRTHSRPHWHAVHPNAYRTRAISKPPMYRVICECTTTRDTHENNYCSTMMHDVWAAQTPVAIQLHKYCCRHAPVFCRAQLKWSQKKRSYLYSEMSSDIFTRHWTFTYFQLHMRSPKHASYEYIPFSVWFWICFSVDVAFGLWINNVKKN